MLKRSMGEGSVSLCLLSLGTGPGVSLSLAWELGLVTHLLLRSLSPYLSDNLLPFFSAQSVSAGPQWEDVTGG